MKKAILEGKILRYMQKAYDEDDRELFAMDDLDEYFPDVSRKDISRALYALQGAGIVTVLDGDDEAYASAYNPDGLTKLIADKGAGAVKDAIGWLIGFLQ